MMPFGEIILIDTESAPMKRFFQQWTDMHLRAVERQRVHEESRQHLEALLRWEGEGGAW